VNRDLPVTASIPTSFFTFLRKAHHRRIFWRTLEFTGLGTLCGAALAAAALPVLWWCGVADVSAPAAVATALGAVCGLLASLRQVPSLFDTALEADRQLDLADLLSSALLAGRRQSDASFALALVLAADAAVRGRKPSVLVLHRLGARGWSGIGLSVGIVLTAASMLSAPNPTRALATAQDPHSIQSFAPFGDARSDKSLQSSAMVRRGDERDRPRRTSANPSDPAVNASDNDRAPSSPDRPGTNGGQSAIDGAGTMAGKSRTSKGNVPSHDLAKSSSSASPDGTRADGGAGRATLSDIEVIDHYKNGTVIRDAQPDASPPWESSDWPAHRDAALNDVRSGRVPDAYRDLVRDYFSR
jgi:hypothetical protein